jgi:hypothetical protein
MKSSEVFGQFALTGRKAAKLREPNKETFDTMPFRLGRDQDK